MTDPQSSSRDTDPAASFMVLVVALIIAIAGVALGTL
jgi:hypothetical protein